VRSNAPSIHISKGAWNVPCARYQNKSGSDTCVMKNSSKSTHFELVYKDKCIRHDGDLICLTDLWKVSGQPSGKRDPRRWKTESGQEFIDSVAKKLKVPVVNIYKTVRGRGGATYAHSEIAEAYQLYLRKKVSPKQQIEKEVRNALVTHLKKIYSAEVKTQVAIETGFLDILTPKEVIEVKNSRDWKAALGQILVYGLSFPDRKKRIHLFNNENRESIKIIEKTCKKFKVVVSWDSL